MTAEAQAKADHASAIFEALADKWAADYGLTAMIKLATSPMDLKPNVPPDVRLRFRLRMEAQIDALARQAFIEGAYRAITGLQDERAALARLKRRKT